jgi:hypothetical protein
LLRFHYSRTSTAITATARAVMLGIITAAAEPNASPATQSNVLSVFSLIIHSVLGKLEPLAIVPIA